MSTGYLAQYASLRGLAPSLSFIVLVLVLVIFPSRLPQVVSSAVRGGRLSGGSPSPGGRSFAGLGAIAVVGALIPLFASSKILSFTTGLVTAIELLSLALLIRLSGQVSLCQVSFAAVGAGSFAQLAGEGVPWLIAVLLAGLIAVPVGALVAITAIRLSGIYLAIATFGFGILLQRLLYTSGAMFGSSGSLASPRPTIGGLDTDTGYYYVVLTFALVSALLVLLIARSRLGRMLRALGDSPTALTTAGLNVNITKVVVFCASAFLAAVSGALSGPVIGRTSSTDFFPVSSLVLVVVLLINGRGLILPSLRAALTFAIPAYISYFGRHADYLAPLFGLAAVLVCIGETRGGSTRKAEDSADPGPSRRRREGSLSGANRELVAS
jgi:ABC-type branched-subunit amino acid transport system permease subunit